MAFYMQPVRIRQVRYGKTGELNRQESARTVRAGGKRYIGLLNRQWDSRIRILLARGLKATRAMMGCTRGAMGICETANEPRDPRAFCLRKSDDLDVTKVEENGGDGGDANANER